jgi:integrase/recombinase XerD
MARSVRVRVSGPLGPYAAGYRRELTRRGYSSWTVVSYLYSLAWVSRWMTERGVAAADLDAECVGRFLADVRSNRRVRRSTPRGLNALLGYLRGLGVAPVSATAMPGTVQDALLDEFVGFLRAERGLAEQTICWYRRAAELFLSSRLGRAMNVGALTARDVNAFVLAQVGRRSAGSLNNLVTAVRALLRFFYLRGYTATPLAAAAPRTVGWCDRGPSRGLDPQQVARLLASCDRRTSTGRRDFAVLTVLARLGLRAGEVAALRLEDVNWRAGEITVRGKGNRRDRLPLPVDVGRAIADYCRRGRPRADCRAVFLHGRAPYAALTPSAVGKVVERGCDRAGLPRVGAHRLRHSAAAALRRAGAPLFEIGQLLRHQHAVTTAGYANSQVLHQVGENVQVAWWDGVWSACGILTVEAG